MYSVQKILETIRTILEQIIKADFLSITVMLLFLLLFSGFFFMMILSSQSKKRAKKTLEMSPNVEIPQNWLKFNSFSYINSHV